ncbi:MAG: glucodextranase DOMON-like domain-containing protein [Acidobacteriota bacterium]|nr:glucodextranase DOMON-like domain-containing protein [Acidobacteriota bacterium]
MKLRLPLHPVLVGLILALAVAPMSLEAASKKQIFELQDPRGDDYGGGNLTYPIRTEFERGDLDVVAFRALRARGGTRFEVEFAGNVRTTERGAIDELGTDLTSVARHGFYTFNVDVYIDKDRVPGSGGVEMLPGRKAELQPEFAWDRAVILTPRPAVMNSALKRMWIRTLNEAVREEQGEEVMDDQAADKARAQAVRASLVESVFFPTQIRVRGREVSFFVPDEFLGGEADPSWAYTVVVTGADLISSFDLVAKAGFAPGVADNLMVVPVGPGSWRDRFGGGREDSPLQPPLVDIFVPSGTTQERLLSDFNSDVGRPARLPGIVPAEAAAESDDAP